MVGIVLAVLALRGQVEFPLLAGGPMPSREPAVTLAALAAVVGARS